MSNGQVTQWVTVLNPQGLHARPADMLARAANRFQSQIDIVKDGETCDAKSILSILTLAATQGTRMELRARGVDAKAAITALAHLFEQGFEEMADSH